MIKIQYMELADYRRLIESTEDEEMLVEYNGVPFMLSPFRRYMDRLRKPDGTRWREDDFPFNIYKEPRKMAIWVQKRVGDVFVQVDQFGGRPSFRRIYKGVVKESGKDYKVLYFCQDEHFGADNRYDQAIMDISNPNKDYTRIAGL